MLSKIFAISFTVQNISKCQFPQWYLWLNWILKLDKVVVFFFLNLQTTEDFNGMFPDPRDRLGTCKKTKIYNSRALLNALAGTTRMYWNLGTHLGDGLSGSFVRFLSVCRYGSRIWSLLSLWTKPLPYWEKYWGVV